VTRFIEARLRAVVLGTYLLSAVLTGVSVLVRADLVTSIVPVPSFLAVAVLSVGFLLPLFYTYLIRLRKYLAPAVMVGVWVVVVLAPPKVTKLHEHGRGTDQGDCVIVGVERLTHGQWPYDVTRMWSGNPLSCGPNWLVLHAPLILVASYPIAMAVLFTASATVVAALRGWQFTSVFITLVGLSPGFWVSFVDGNDFVTFGMCVVAVIVLAESTSRWARVVGAVLSVLVAHFRVPFVLLPAVALINRRSPRILAITTRNAVIASAVSVAVFVGFYLWEPQRMVSEGPLHVLGKFSSMLGVTLNTGVLALAFVGVSILLAALVSRLPSQVNVLFYCVALLIPVSLLSLVSSVKSGSTLTHAFEFWEGLSWLTALVCISAFVLTGQLQETKELGPSRPADVTTKHIDPQTSRSTIEPTGHGLTVEKDR
jgi:hypothetical protein